MYLSSDIRAMLLPKHESADWSLVSLCGQNHMVLNQLVSGFSFSKGMRTEALAKRRWLGIFRHPCSYSPRVLGLTSPSDLVFRK